MIFHFIRQNEMLIAWISTENGDKIVFVVEEVEKRPAEKLQKQQRPPKQ